MTQIPTTDQLRDKIDSEATGEKLGFPDPAAAPLGTDAEAAGKPPSPAERLIEAEAQVPYEKPAPPDGRLVYLLAVLAVGLAIGAITYLAGAR